MNALEALKQTAALLSNWGIQQSEKEAELLISYCLGIDKVGLYRDNPELNDESSLKLLSVLHRRRNREPVQYIVGYVEFYGLTIKVGRGVLIPRPETELLVEEAIKTISNLKSQISNLKILDLCTGSGCLALAIAKHLPHAEVYGTDISEEAITHAIENASINSISNATFLKGHLFEPIASEAFYDAAFDIIVSNPPYIKSSDIAGLQTEIRDWEPLDALDGGDDGLRFYREIIPSAMRHMKKGSYLMLELGIGQAAAVSGMAKEAGLGDVVLIKDYSGVDRILKVMKV